MLDAILQREREAPMAYPSGIAIPHIRVEGLADTLIGMTFLQNPMDYDGIKVNWVVLIFTDKSSSKIYLNIVAALLKLSRDEEAMKSLHGLHDGHDVIHWLKQAKVEVGTDVTVADIMIRNPFCVGPDDVLRLANSLINEHKVSMLPVTDKDDTYLGELNILDILKVGVPDYLMMMEDLKFLKSYEPLENLFEKEDEITAGEIMQKDNKVLEPDDSIVEAVYLMLKEGRRYFCVVEDGKLLGVVTAMDVFRKVVKA
jgi:CBS domain-containing protein